MNVRVYTVDTERFPEAEEAVASLVEGMGLKGWTFKVYRLPFVLPGAEAFTTYEVKRRRAAIFVGKNKWGDDDTMAHELTHPKLGVKGLDDKLSDDLQEEVADLVAEVVAKMRRVKG